MDVITFHAGVKEKWAPGITEDNDCEQKPINIYGLWQQPRNDSC